MAKKTLSERLGRRLREARTERGISLDSMWSVGLSAAYVKKLESGDHDMQVGTLVRIATVLQVNPADFLDGL